MRLAITVAGLIASTGAPIRGGFFILETQLLFCPSCRIPNIGGAPCPQCGQPCTDEAHTMAESLLNTILAKDPDRAAMAVDVLIRWYHDPRLRIPLSILLKDSSDPFLLTLAARGLGWLGDPEAIPSLADFLLDESKPYVARIAAVRALQGVGGQKVIEVLEQAQHSPRPSVAEAAIRALQDLLPAVSEKQDELC